jgi:hypothetical protein
MQGARGRGERRRQYQPSEVILTVLVFSVDLRLRKTINHVCSAFAKQTQVSNLHTLRATTIFTIPVSHDIPICSPAVDPIRVSSLALPRSGLLTIFRLTCFCEARIRQLRTGKASVLARPVRLNELRDRARISIHTGLW